MQKHLLLLGILFLYLPMLFGQEPDDIKLSTVTFIENGMVLDETGKTFQRKSILIENGIIKKIGAGIKAPGNAKIIKADSLFIYPSFIAGYSHAGIPKGEDKQEERAKNPGTPTYEQAGITPQKTIIEDLKLDDSSVKDLRSAGFGISHSVPRGRMLAGQGSLILLGNKENQSLLKQNISVAASLKRSAKRVYPSTVIAVMAKFRDLDRQSEFALKHENDYKASPIGFQRPTYDAEVKALYNLNSKTTPVFFEAEKTLDVSRVLTLNEDLKWNIILTEVKQAWPNIKAIKSQNIPILISLDLPKDEDVKKDSTKTVDPVQESLMKRKQESIAAYQGQAKNLHANNILFSFSYIDVKPKDIHKQILKIHETGVDSITLINALTSVPAKMLGIENIAGSVTEGKLANLIITDRSYFHKDVNIEMNIVEGQLYEYEKKSKKKKKKEGSTDEDLQLEGQWNIEVDVAGDIQKAQLFFKKSDGSYSGHMIDSEGEKTELQNISLDDDSVEFSLESDIDGMKVMMESEVKINGSDMEGSISVGTFGSFTLVGTRVQNPE